MASVSRRSGLVGCGRRGRLTRLDQVRLQPHFLFVSYRANTYSRFQLRAQGFNVFYVVSYDMMKTTRKSPVRELRKIIGLTQSEFASLIGASKDAVVSWELGRNKLSEPFARRIAFATGVDEESLTRRRGPLLAGMALGRPPYTAEDYRAYRETYWGRSNVEAAREHLKYCKDTLELIFLAAARPAGGKIRNRLPGVLDAFSQWCGAVASDFRLGPQIQEQLGQRRFKLTFRCSYG
jgi:transcriptional regulator with XRE-family HTH domain